MADYFDQQNREGVGYVPPPPNDVSIRTMESDIRSMALSGGSFVRPDQVQMSQKNQAKAQIPAPSPGGTQDPSVKKSKGFLPVVVLVLIMLLGALGYFLYPLFNKNSGTPPTTDGEVGSTPSLPEVPGGALSPKFNHESFFRKSGDSVIDMNIKFAATEITDLENYDQKVSRLLAQASEVETLVEFIARREGGQHLSLAEFFEYSGNNVFTSEFMEQNFNQDFTFFTYKDKNGFWPGLVIQLKKGKNWVVVKPEVSKMEKSENLGDFFITLPGDRVGDFKDVLISSQSARILKYSKPSANLIYGWFHNYIVISTSDEGLRAAIERL
ncbi:MAG: hypothetical protein AAB594_01375 [Patescibacteria group bacterium]